MFLHRHKNKDACVCLHRHKIYAVIICACFWRNIKINAIVFAHGFWTDTKIRTIVFTHAFCTCFLHMLFCTDTKNKNGCVCARFWRNIFTHVSETLVKTNIFTHVFLESHKIYAVVVSTCF